MAKTDDTAHVDYDDVDEERKNNNKNSEYKNKANENAKTSILCKNYSILIGSSNDGRNHEMLAT